MIQDPMTSEDRPSCHRCGEPMKPQQTNAWIKKASEKLAVQVYGESCRGPVIVGRRKLAAEFESILGFMQTFSCPSCGATTEPS